MKKSNQSKLKKNWLSNRKKRGDENMVSFSKKVVVNLGNYESLALEVSECPSFEVCDKILDNELKNFNLTHKGVRRILCD